MTLDRGWPVIVCAASGPSLTDDQCAAVAAELADVERQITAKRELIDRLKTGARQ